ncbi:MAG: hypothetical protein QG615_1766 [Nitrospirota bacterium]|nr:hypothetical protein [Nitrospirota bacterium]
MAGAAAIGAMLPGEVPILESDIVKLLDRIAGLEEELMFHGWSISKTGIIVGIKELPGRTLNLSERFVRDCRVPMTP